MGSLPLHLPHSSRVVCAHRGSLIFALLMLSCVYISEAFLVIRIWGSHGGEYEDGCLLGCSAVKPSSYPPPWDPQILLNRYIHTSTYLPINSTHPPVSVGHNAKLCLWIQEHPTAQTPCSDFQFSIQTPCSDLQFSIQTPCSDFQFSIQTA
jgi:hypothetical protein